VSFFRRLENLRLSAVKVLNIPHACNVVAIDLSCWAAGQKRRYRLPEGDVISPDQLMSALKRYLEEHRDSEQEVASQIGVNHHTLRRWLSDQQSPKKGKLALTASFLRRAGYL
jgi:hypothetical protein